MIEKKNSGNHLWRVWYGCGYIFFKSITKNVALFIRTVKFNGQLTLYTVFYCLSKLLIVVKTSHFLNNTNTCYSVLIIWLTRSWSLMINTEQKTRFSGIVIGMQYLTKHFLSIWIWMEWSKLSMIKILFTKLITVKLLEILQQVLVKTLLNDTYLNCLDVA